MEPPQYRLARARVIVLHEFGIDAGGDVAEVGGRQLLPGDILEIAPAAGGDTLMYPFTKEVAPIIDLAGGRIVVDPPTETEGENKNEKPGED